MAAKAVKSITESVPVNIQLQTTHQKIIAENKRNITAILKTIIFCGTHDLPLRGKDLHERIFEDLIKLRIECGDVELKEHIQGQKNPVWTSPMIQNELINLCGIIIKKT